MVKRYKNENYKGIDIKFIEHYGGVASIIQPHGIIVISKNKLEAFDETKKRIDKSKIVGDYKIYLNGFGYHKTTEKFTGKRIRSSFTSKQQAQKMLDLENKRGGWTGKVIYQPTK